ncbi:unnamed protein product, partial [Heterosigma akashiwo]
CGSPKKKQQQQQNIYINIFSLYKNNNKQQAKTQKKQKTEQAILQMPLSHLCASLPPSFSSTRHSPIVATPTPDSFLLFLRRPVLHHQVNQTEQSGEVSSCDRP